MRRCAGSSISPRLFLVFKWKFFFNKFKYVPKYMRKIFDQCFYFLLQRKGPELLKSVNKNSLSCVRNVKKKPFRKNRLQRSRARSPASCTLAALRSCNWKSISNFYLKLEENIFGYGYYWLRLSVKNALFQPFKRGSPLKHINNCQPI